MKEKNKNDIVKIKGLIGLFLSLGSIIYIKVITIYDLHSNYKLLMFLILFITCVIGMFLSQPYINRLITGSEKFK